MGTAASLFVLWLFKAGIFEGLDVHFLGLSVLTLMLGFRNAIIASFIALLGANAVGYGSWENFGFFPAALSIALKTLTLGAFYYIEGTYTWDIIYQPTWVYTFHDKFYLDN